MHSPGVTVRPLVQMTGEQGFNEVFFEDVRVPKKNLVGEKNQGWQVAITTLMFERTGIGGDARHDRRCTNSPISRKRSSATAGPPGTTPACVSKSPASRARRRRSSTRGFRQLTRRLKGLPPGPEGSVMKLGTSELNLRMAKFAMELLGPYSQFEQARRSRSTSGKWSYRMLARAHCTIAGGTSEIQHNIIGERVLGLPKG